ncbi:MAG: ABC transporter substrate-binding protein [Chloroflexi bacterium]|nr:ABC transporter substrate-binding protein [Chloroflexota bacterium]
MRKDVADRLGITEKSPLKAKLQALKGLTLASTSKGGDNDLIIRWLLRREGLDPERDLDMTYISKDADGIAAFKRGAVQAITYAPPASTQVLDSGEGIMLINLRKGDVPEIAERLGVTMTVNREYAPQHRDIIESAIRAIWRSVRLMWDSKEDARRTLKDFELFRNEPEASFNEALDLQFDNLQRDVLIPMDAVRKSIAIFNEMTALIDPAQQVKVTAEQFYDPSYAETAKKQLGF